MAPSSLRQIATVTKYELLKYLRGRRLLAIVLLTIIISAIFLVVPPAIGSAYEKDPKEFTVNMLSFLSILAILSATFFGADAIVSEYESKTGYFLFPNPIRKTAIFLGKFIASVLVSVGAIGLYYVIAVISVRIIDGSIPANTGLSFAYSLVYLFAILAIAYLFSAMMRSSVYSLILTFFTFFLILSIMAYSLSGSSAKTLKRLSQTPLTAQREKRLCVLHQPPKRSGKSRHGVPTRNFQITASTKRRLPRSLFRPTVPGRPGSKCSIRAN